MPREVPHFVAINTLGASFINAEIMTWAINYNQQEYNKNDDDDDDDDDDYDDHNDNYDDYDVDDDDDGDGGSVGDDNDDDDGDVNDRDNNNDNFDNYINVSLSLVLTLLLLFLLLPLLFVSVQNCLDEPLVRVSDLIFFLRLIASVMLHRIYSLRNKTFSLKEKPGPMYKVVETHRKPCNTRCGNVIDNKVQTL